MIHKILNDSRSLGVLLILCTIVSLALSNIGGIAPLYTGMWNIEIPFFHHIHLPHSIIHFINDGLMTIFFFHVALDIKREVMVGELSSPSRIVVPTVSAIFGVLFPALIFMGFAMNTHFEKGWAIPAATDIAFTIGMISLLGKAVPRSYKVFITALAIIDDLIAILIVALFYGENLQLQWLGYAAIVLFVIYGVNKLLNSELGYTIMLLLGVVLWYCFFQSGIHATFAGVLLAFMMPTKKLDHYIHKLEPSVNFLIVPLFALANTSIAITPSSISAETMPLVLGILLGLFIGKPLGISTAVFILNKMRLVKMDSFNWGRFIGVTILAGIGFTMSIFISVLSFKTEPHLQDTAKLSVIITSALAMIVGYLWIHFASKNKIDSAE